MSRRFKSDVVRIVNLKTADVEILHSGTEVIRYMFNDNIYTCERDVQTNEHDDPVHLDPYGPLPPDNSTSKVRSRPVRTMRNSSMARSRPTQARLPLPNLSLSAYYKASNGDFSTHRHEIAIHELSVGPVSLQPSFRPEVFCILAVYFGVSVNDALRNTDNSIFGDDITPTSHQPRAKDFLSCA